MIQSVFVLLPSEENACVFFGQIDENDVVEDLGNILGTIVDYAQNLNDSQIKAIQISQGKFAYGKFGVIYLIFKIQRSDDMDEIKEILKKMANGFIKTYKSDLDSFSGDTSAFDSFTNEIQSYITVSKPKPKVKPSKSIDLASLRKGSATKPTYSAPTITQGSSSSGKDTNTNISKAKIRTSKSEPEIKVPAEPEKKKKSYLKSAKPIEFVPTKMPEITTVSSDKAIISPDKRDAYANGIDEYMKDEILWNESQAVMKEYTAEFYEGLIAKLQIFLSISITHHYEIIIDFQNYPEKPIVSFSDGLKGELGEYNDCSYFFKNWDVKIPPHVLELVREFEKILMNLKTRGKLEATAAMPEASLPELEPLETLAPLPKSKRKIKTETLSSKEQKTEEKESKEKVIIKDNSDENKVTGEPKLIKPQINKKALEKKKKIEEKEQLKKKKEDEALAKRKKKYQDKLKKKAEKDEMKKMKQIMKESDEETKADYKKI